MTTGIVLTSAALPLGLMGAYLSDQAYTDCLNDRPATEFGPSDGNDCKNSKEARNVVIGIVAITMLGVGIPLIVYGAKKVPLEPRATITPWASARAAGATFRLTL